jgi:hypothetical protein
MLRISPGVTDIDCGPWMIQRCLPGEITRRPWVSEAAVVEAVTSTAAMEVMAVPKGVLQEVIIILDMDIWETRVARSLQHMDQMVQELAQIRLFLRQIMVSAWASTIIMV